MVVMSDVFALVYNFHMPLSSKLKIVRLMELVAIYFRSISVYVGVMAIYCGVTSYAGFIFCWCVFCCFSAAGGEFACSGVTVCRVLPRLCKRNM
jgi:hypothetical protein